MRIVEAMTERTAQLLRDVLEMCNGHETVHCRVVLAMAFATIMMCRSTSESEKALKQFVEDAATFREFLKRPSARAVDAPGARAGSGGGPRSGA